MMPIARAAPGPALAGLVLLAAATATRAQEANQDIATVAGRSTYKTYCASCHGTGGKGDGPFADRLRFRPSDLTLLAKRNGGTYPDDEVFRSIDGRKPVKGHGGPDMPIWGDAFRNAESGYSEEKVKERIRGLVEFLKTLQAPAR